MKTIKLKDKDKFLEEVVQMKTIQIIDSKDGEKIISLRTESLYEKFLNSQWIGQVVLDRDNNEFHFYTNNFNKFKEFNDLVIFVNTLNKYKADEVIVAEVKE